MSLTSASIRRPVAVAMLFIAVAALGVISFARLPIDLLPDVAYPRLVIHTAYAGVGPAEVERFVSEPVERVVASVPGVERVESVSREGVSLVTLRFAWGTDMDFAALSVRERLDNLRGGLPELADRPTVLRTDPSADPVMALSVAGADLWRLKDLGETVFRRRLEQIDGVAQAAVTGGYEREMHVEVDARALEAHGVSVSDVSRAIAAANASAPGGTVRRGRSRYTLRTLGEFLTVAEIGDVVVGRGADGSSLRVRDVARVEDGFEERESLARFDGRESVGLLLFKESDANAVQVARRVDEVVEELRAEFPDVAIEIASTQAAFVSDAISNVVQALLWGGLLAFLVLFLFLRDARYPVAIALAIPISVLATFPLLDAAGVSLNIMSLGGLALGVGMLVDNSIVVLENVFRHREQGLRASVAAAVGADEVRGAITASTLTTIAVFGPIVYVEGVAGELFSALSLAVAFSLLASLLVALTLLPTLAARWDSMREVGTGTVSGKSGDDIPRSPQFRIRSRSRSRLFDVFDAAFSHFTTWYERRLAWSLDHRRAVVLSALSLLLLALALGATLDRRVLPDVDQGAFTLALELPRGTPLEETSRVAARLEAALRADDDVAAVFTRVGRQEAVAGIEDRESGLHTAVLDVRLRDGASTSDVVARMRPVFASFPPGALAVETGQATALGKLLGGGDADLAVRVRGEDLEGALAYAGALARELVRRPELANVRLGTELGQPELRVSIDRERAAAYGIEPAEVAQSVEAYMRGVVATEFVSFDRRVPVVVRLPEADRRSPATLERLRVRGVPLRELVVVDDALGPVETRRLEQARLVPVLADARGSIDDAVAAIGAVLADVPAPAGLRVEIGGENEEMRRGFRDLGFAFLLAVFLVYMILAAQFESFLHPFTILLSVPLAVVGAVLGLWITGSGIDTMSLIGLVILVGIVDNDAIVKIDYTLRRMRAGSPTRVAILEAGRARLRPILMTTLTTLLGLFPMALGFGTGADLRAPLAVTVFFGLGVATLLTLFVIPVAFSLVQELRERRSSEPAAPETVPVPVPSRS